MRHKAITDELVRLITPLRFGPPVTHVYNPLIYARSSYNQYLDQFGRPPKEIVLVGMNPGPWGMAQTGIPFGDVESVANWLNIRTSVGQPQNSHLKRPVQGFDCPRREVSGQRIWGWAKNTFGTPGRFFNRFFIANYCPLAFMEESGRNRTPDKLPAKERGPLMAACDAALKETITYLKPHFVIGVGAFAASRIEQVCRGLKVATGRITHPSPANPKANRGWGQLVTSEFKQMGIQL